MSLADAIRAAGVKREKTFEEHVQEVEAREREEAAAARAAEPDEYDDDELSLERVVLNRGEGRRSVEMADSVASQVARLQAWEQQLQAYSDQLTEQGWKTWKSSAVTSVMHELQRKVVPDLWRDEVARAEQSVQTLQERVEMANQKEAALLKRIEELEHGPGSAKELKEQLETAELELNRQQQRERQNSVFKQLLSSGTVAANAGGGAPARPRKRATIGDMSTDSATSAAREAASAASAASAARSKERRGSVPPPVAKAASAPLTSVAEDGEGQKVSDIVPDVDVRHGEV